jgi:hypothetical protein
MIPTKKRRRVDRSRGQRDMALLHVLKQQPVVHPVKLIAAQDKIKFIGASRKYRIFADGVGGLFGTNARLGVCCAARISTKP